MAIISLANPDVISWYNLAACKGSDLSLFFGAEGIPFDPEPARRICNGDPERGTSECPVKNICLERGMRRPSIPGIWGGMEQEERNAERRRRMRRVAPSDQPDDSAESDTGAEDELLRLAERQTAIEITMGLPPTPHPAALPEDKFAVIATKGRALGPRLARLIEHLAVQLIADDGKLTVDGDPFLQGLAKALGHPDWDQALKAFTGLRQTEPDHYQLQVEKLVTLLARRKCTITVSGEPALEQLAKAIGYPTWAKAKFSHIELWGKADIVKYLRATSQLVVRCHAAQEQLDREERQSRMPGDQWVAQPLAPLRPALVPPEYQHLVREEPHYVRAHPYKRGVVDSDIIWEILRRIVLKKGLLQDVVSADLSEELGVTANTTGRALQNMDAGGLIQRDRSKEHGRNFSDLRLTGLGVEWMLANRRGFMQRHARQSA